MQGNIYLGITAILVLSVLGFFYQQSNTQVEYVGKVVSGEITFEGFKQGCLVTLEDGTKHFIHGSNCITATKGSEVYLKKSPLVTGYFLRGKVLT